MWLYSLMFTIRYTLSLNWHPAWCSLPITTHALSVSARQGAVGHLGNCSPCLSLTLGLFSELKLVMAML